MKNRKIIIIAVLALCLLLPLTVWADPCPYSADGTHAWGNEWTVDWENSCGYDGQKSRKCTNCGAIDQDTVQSIPATGEHTWTEWQYAAAAPSCTAPGTQTRWCYECQKYETREVPPIDHQYGEWTILQEPTCTAEGVRVRYCQMCKNPEEETIPAKGHTPVPIPAVAADCVTGGKTEGSQCSVCGEILTAPTDTPVLPHQYSDWITIQEATCTEDGIRVCYCQNCQDQKSEAIPAKGHTPVPIPAVAATCTEAGNTEGSRCSACGAILAAPSEIPAHGHTWSEWQETEPGKMVRTCAWCDETLEKYVEQQSEPGLLLTAEKITRLEPADGYSDVYAVDMKLENTGDIPLQTKVWATYGDGDPGEFAEVITDDIVGIDYYNPPAIQPGETISFQYLTRTNGMYGDGEKRVISRLVSAQGRSENPDALVTAVQPVVINLPAADGLLLTVENMHRAGTGADEVITFDLTVTNQVTGWSLISVLAKDMMGQQRDGDQFTGWPEEGLLLGYGQSHSFSLSFRPSAVELEKVTENNVNAWISRYVTVQDLQGHAAEVLVTAKLRTPQTAETFLDGGMEKPDHLYADESASIPVSLTLRNIGDIPVTNPAVKGVLMTGGGRTLQTYTLTPENGVSVLQPQESAAFTLTASVGPEDESATMADEEFLLRFAFYAEYEYEHPEKGSSRGESNIWQQAIPVWDMTAEDPRATYIAPVLTVTFEDREYHPGETVWFDLKVENVNPEDTIQGIRFEWFPVDAQGEPGEPLVFDLPDVVLNPGESYELNHKYSFGVDQEAASGGVYVLDFVAWCHSPAYDFYSNAAWSGLLHMKAD